MCANNNIINSKSILIYALEYARDGIYVTPGFSITKDGHCACGDKSCQLIGRHPREDSNLLSGTIDQYEIRDWWVANPNDNILTPTGGGRLIALEFERWVDHRDAKESCNLEHEPTKCFQVEGRPPIYLYRTDVGSPIKDYKGNLGAGIKIFGDDDYLPLPPSKYDHKRKYTVSYHGPISWLPPELYVYFKD